MTRLKGLKSLEVYEHDLPSEISIGYTKTKYLAVDTETGGLDYRENPLHLVQLSNQDGQVSIIQNPDSNSYNLIRLLQDARISMIFHNAAFDLAFLKMGLMAEVGVSVHCTKTLMKIVFPQYSSGLGSSLKSILDISLNKNINHQKWGEADLSDRQLEYAAGDVLYLYRLLKVLKTTCSPRQYNIYCRSMQIVRLKAFTEVEGYTDLFQFEKEHQEVSEQNRLWWNRLLSLQFEEEKDVTM
jgi:ribonuclease D